MPQPKTVLADVSNEDIGTLLNTRTFLQYCEMFKHIISGKCPFCELDTTLNAVMCENERWRGWLNPFPARHHAYHIVIAHRLHLTHLLQLTLDDWKNFGAIVTDFGEKFGLIGGALIMRFGDPNFNAGSVRHLHLNIQVPDGTGEVRVPLAKNPKDVAKKMVVIEIFEKLRIGVEPWKLTDAEWELVKDRVPDYMRRDEGFAAIWHEEPKK